MSTESRTCRSTSFTLTSVDGGQIGDLGVDISPFCPPKPIGRPPNSIADPPLTVDDRRRIESERVLAAEAVPQVSPGQKA